MPLKINDLRQVISNFLSVLDLASKSKSSGTNNGEAAQDLETTSKSWFCLLIFEFGNETTIGFKDHAHRRFENTIEDLKCYLKRKIFF